MTHFLGGLKPFIFPLVFWGPRVRETYQKTPCLAKNSRIFEKIDAKTVPEKKGYERTQPKNHARIPIFFAIGSMGWTVDLPTWNGWFFMINYVGKYTSKIPTWIPCNRWDFGAPTCQVKSKWRLLNKKKWALRAGNLHASTIFFWGGGCSDC